MKVLYYKTFINSVVGKEKPSHLAIKELKEKELKTINKYILSKNYEHIFYDENSINFNQVFQANIIIIINSESNILYNSDKNLKLIKQIADNHQIFLYFINVEN